MLEQLTHGLRAIDGDNTVLQSVNVEVVFNNLFCETILTQVYKNVEDTPIEAVYTFPLASRAVLLGLKVNIGGRVLQGLVMGKASAEEQYEEAITNGDAAIMLEQVQLGLYSVNVGNILAGEQMSVTIHYGELYAWQGNSLRFFLPTTSAPRFGNPEAAGLQPHQIQEYGLAEIRLQLKLTLAGVLSKALLDSPSHQIAVETFTAATVVTLAAGEACMDRDFILNINLPQGANDVVLLDRDHDGGYVALASFAPRFPASGEAPPKSVKIVVDCSGSMNGDSITQARQAISDILSQLRPHDYFNLIAFGDSHRTFFTRQVLASKDNITKARRLLRSLEADMGGTEMLQALQVAVNLPGPAITHDILLITDGEIWGVEELTRTMKKSGHRVFVVGVGSSVSEGFLRQLSHETGGACELVAPNEQMTAKIVRHFNRIFLPRAEGAAVHWPQVPIEVVPQTPGPIYGDDTVHVFARFSEKPKGAVSLAITLADGRTFTQSAEQQEEIQLPSGAEFCAPGPLARMAIHQMLSDQDATQTTALAVRYQLMSTYTNYLVVDARGAREKGAQLPALRKVPQMLAAGWSGTGTVIHESMADYDQPMFCRKKSSSITKFRVATSPKQLSSMALPNSPESFIQHCNRLHTRWVRPVLQLTFFDDLRGCDLPDWILTALRNLTDQMEQQPPEEHIVVAFLWALTQSAVGGLFNRNSLRAIKKAMKTLGLEEQLRTTMTEAFARVSKDDWGQDQSPDAGEFDNGDSLG